MGQLVIEVPQNVNRSYQVDDSEFGESLLRKLEEFERTATKSKPNPAIVPPRRQNLKEDGDAVLGIWSDSESVADEIALKLRMENRQAK